jgi:hypothetical protein
MFCDERREIVVTGERKLHVQGFEIHVAKIIIIELVGMPN